MLNGTREHYYRAQDGERRGHPATVYIKTILGISEKREEEGTKCSNIGRNRLCNFGSETNVVTATQYHTLRKSTETVGEDNRPMKDLHV
jgi:hypothetical protein